MSSLLDILVRLKDNTYLSLFMQLGDKGLSFLSPILVLYAFQNEYEYINLEYIISIGLLILSFSDMGVKSYTIYSGFKLENRNLQCEVSGFIYLISLVGLILVCVSYLGSYLDIVDKTLTFVLIHTVSLSVAGVYAQMIIVRGFPAYFSSINLIFKVLTIVILTAIYFLNIEFLLDYYFISNFVLILFALYFSFNKNQSCHIKFRTTLYFIRKSLVYSWPLMLSSLFSLFVMNFAKIYSFSSLEDNVTAGFFFWSRIVFVLQLIHLAVTPMLLNGIYKSKTITVFRGEIMKTYAIAISIGVLILVILYFLLLYFNIADVPFIGFVNFIILTLYTVSWCFSAFFEAYYSSVNRNKSLFIYSSLMVSIYAVAMMIISPSSVRILLVIMMCCGLIYNLLLLISLNNRISILGQKL